MGPPRRVILRWIDCVNAADPAALIALYAADAVHEREGAAALIGTAAIRGYFEQALRISPNIADARVSEVGDWGLLQWADPGGRSNCSLFQIEGGRIRLTRGVEPLLAQARAAQRGDIWELS
jgi:hypothetical protein